MSVLATPTLLPSATTVLRQPQEHTEIDETPGERSQRERDHKYSRSRGGHRGAGEKISSDTRPRPRALAGSLLLRTAPNRAIVACASGKPAHMLQKSGDFGNQGAQADQDQPRR